MAFREKMEGFGQIARLNAAGLAQTLMEVPRLHPKRRSSLPHRPNTVGECFKKRMSHKTSTMLARGVRGPECEEAGASSFAPPRRAGNGKGEKRPGYYPLSTAPL